MAKMLRIIKIYIGCLILASFLGLRLRTVKHRKRRTKPTLWLLVMILAIELSDFISLLLSKGTPPTQILVSTGLYTLSILLQIDHLLFASNPAWHACLTSWVGMTTINLLAVIGRTTDFSTWTIKVICGVASASSQLTLNLALFGVFMFDNGGRILLDDRESGAVPEESNPSESDLAPKKIVKDIRDAGGIWAFLKRFTIFKDWILPNSPREYGLCCGVFIIVVAGVGLQLYQPHAEGAFVDEVVEMMTTGDLSRLSRFTGFLVFVEGTASILPHVKGYLFRRFSYVRQARATSRIHSFFMSHDASFFDKLDPTTTTKSIDRGLGVVVALDDLLFDVVPQAFQLIAGVGELISLYGYEATSVVLFGATLSIIVGLRLEKVLVPLYEGVRETDNIAEQTRQNGLRGWKTVRQCGQVVQQINKYANTVGKRKDQNQGISNIHYSVVSIMLTLEIVGSYCCLYLVAARIVTGKSTIGSIPTFWGYSGLVRASLRYFENISESLLERLCEANDMRRLLEEKPTMRYGKETMLHPDGDISFSDVNFSYSKDGEDKIQVFNQFSLELKAGKTTAIVGGSGLGKSTLPHLIIRLYDLACGVLKIGGQDITSVKFGGLSNHIAYMSQKTDIFNDTIENNIKFANPQATLEEVREAARLAAIDDEIMSRDKGYQELVGLDGNNLSGGQRQRIGLARVFLQKEARIVLFDEPTSALDAETEAHVMRSIREVLRDRTVVLIAHRLSSVKEADSIVVLGKGEGGFAEVVETGTHDELCAQEGQYARLWELNTAKTIERRVEDLL